MPELPEMEALRLTKPPCVGPLPGGRGHTWVQPKLVIEVRYKEITVMDANGTLRKKELRGPTLKKAVETLLAEVEKK